MFDATQEVDADEIAKEDITSFGKAAKKDFFTDDLDRE